MIRRKEAPAVTDRIPPEVERVWDEFHGAVNMTSEELRRWLLTDASGERAFASDPDLDIPELGRHVVHILRKRKVDVTREDVSVMRQVIDLVSSRLAESGRRRELDDEWRHALMRVGHDPLKPERSE
jgi:hypothetical protein